MYWGGRSAAQNKHVVARDQRFAYDFLILARGRSGQSYRGSGESNTDYYCFGQPVYAPADGIVVKVENELPDNTPGEMDPRAVLGNCVILDHGRSEFSLFAHFAKALSLSAAGPGCVPGSRWHSAEIAATPLSRTSTIICKTLLFPSGEMACLLFS